MDAMADRRQRALAMATPVVPRAKLDEVLAATAAFAESLSPDTRRQLAALEKLAPAQIAGQTVPVDVAAVIGLVHAHGEIVELLRAEIARLSSELQASKQTSFPL
ncbi:hypothetical protein [Cupriavidus sp. TMH.W2]|uniref:hypothetical protein n=1 Tax=Cupriavidus sp. TMH.W2 TaxID=3434465 RepID=UPI003D771C29